MSPRRFHRRRSAPRRLAAVVAVVAIGCGAPPDPLGDLEAGSARGFDLLLITLDTTRADRLGSYGYAAAETPALDRLAASGLRFEQAATAAPVTLPSHATILTGLLPPAHGVRINAEYRLDPGHRTLAELFAEAGYETAAFVSAFVLDARYGLDQGFALYDDRVDPPAGPAFPGGTLERPAAATADAVLDWLRRREATRPYFAWVHFYDPHAPYAPPADLAGRFAGQPYDGEVAAVDRAVARLLAELEARGSAERTVIVVVGDHGESLGEHGERTHSVFLYEAVTRVPLIVGCPSLFGAAVVGDRVVSTADLLPTLATLHGLVDPERRDGRDWVGASVDPARGVYMESLTPSLDYGWAPLHALRRRSAKLVLAPRPEYYDLGVDPGETTDLFASATGATAADRDAMRLELETLIAAQAPAAGATNAGAPAADATAVPEETRQRLMALGYLAGAGATTGGELADPKDMIGVADLLIETNAHLAAGRLGEALKLARSAVAASPADRSALQALGKVYLRLGRLQEAEEALRRFTAIQPKADVSLLLAQIVILDGRFDEAAALLAEAERLDPRHGGVFIARGDLLARQGDLAGARASYEKAAELDPYRTRGLAAERIRALPGR